VYIQNNKHEPIYITSSCFYYCTLLLVHAVTAVQEMLEHVLVIYLSTRHESTVCIVMSLKCLFMDTTVVRDFSLYTGYTKW